MGSAHQKTIENILVFEGGASIGTHYDQIQFYFRNIGVSGRIESSLQLLPNPSTFICVVFIILPLQYQSLVFSLKNLGKILVNFASLFWELN